jgi:serine protease AprX
VNCATAPSYDASCGAVAGNPKIVVVAAGNSGAEPRTIGAPGVAKNAITVGSFAEWSGDPSKVWQDDGVYLNSFSSRGPVVDGAGNFKWQIVLKNSGCATV